MNNYIWYIVLCQNGFGLMKLPNNLRFALFFRHFNFFDIVRNDDEKELSKRYGQVLFNNSLPPNTVLEFLRILSYWLDFLVSIQLLHEIIICFLSSLTLIYEVPRACLMFFGGSYAPHQPTHIFCQFYTICFLYQVSKFQENVCATRLLHSHYMRVVTQCSLVGRSNTWWPS